MPAGRHSPAMTEKAVGRHYTSIFGRCGDLRLGMVVSGKLTIEFLPVS
jgi:hypothetical protein